MLPETKSRQCDTSTSLRLASFRDPFIRKGNSVELKKLFLLVQDEYNERASIRTFNKFWVDECFVRQSEVLNSKLSRFCEEGSEHRNLSLSWEVQLLTQR